MKKEYKIFLQFLALILVTIYVNVSRNEILATVWYSILLIMYFRSKNEPFWLAFFMVTTDGFMGFLGIYSTLLSLLPSLPGIEMAQIYVILTFIKVSKLKNPDKPFYQQWTKILFAYVIFLLVIGYINGLQGELNLYFKVGKMILPMGLFYTLPRLFTSIDQYASLMKFLFVVFLFAFAAQIFTVFTGFSPAANFRVEEQREMEAGKNLRSFYNPFITLVVLCCALFFLAIKDQKYFSKVYLNIIVILCFGMAFLSATRGWIIGFGFVIVVYSIFINKLDLKNLFYIVSLFLVIFAVSLTFEKVSTQLTYSFERTLTLESLAKGDKSADGTLVRLDERGPKVMEAWSENPVFGWGFSNTFFEKADQHVGHQTLLLHSGIVGLSLLYMFMIFVGRKLVKLNATKESLNPYKKGGLVIVVFLIGWFFIHSTSHQMFSYNNVPTEAFPQAVILALANFIVTYRVKTNPNALQ